MSMIKVDENKALAQGVNISEIYSALSGYFGKSYVNDFNKYGRVIVYICRQILNLEKNLVI